MRRLWIGLLACAALAQEPLTIEQAEALAVANHPQIAAANYTAQAGEFAVQEVRSNLYPTFNAAVTTVGTLPNSNLAAGGIASTSAYNKFASGTQVSQLITDFGRTSHLVESSKLHFQALNDNVVTAKSQILLQVDQAYYSVLRAQAVQRIAQRTVEARQLVSDQVTTLANSKLKSGLDVSFANVNLAEARLLLASAENDVQAAQALLSTSLGYPTPHVFALAEGPNAPKILDPPLDYVREALSSRPDLQSQQLEQQSVQQFAQAEKALKYPSIAAVAGAGVTPLHDSHLSDRYAAGGLNINFPILNGKLYASRRSEAELRASASKETTTDLRNRITRDVHIAWLNANTAFQRIGLTEELVRQSALALDLAQARYNLGLSSIVELSQAQLNATTAEIQGTQARYDYQTRLAELNFAAGLLR